MEHRKSDEKLYREFNELDSNTGTSSVDPLKLGLQNQSSDNYRYTLDNIRKWGWYFNSTKVYDFFERNEKFRINIIRSYKEQVLSYFPILLRENALHWYRDHGDSIYRGRVQYHNKTIFPLQKKKKSLDKQIRDRKRCIHENVWQYNLGLSAITLKHGGFIPPEKLK